jgi:hypothetical protein
VTASGNELGSGAGLSNETTFLITPTAGVTFTGIGVFSENYYSGLEVTSNGPLNVLTTSLTANQNGQISLSGYGVTLNNDTAASPQVVKLTGTGVFNGNYSTGLSVVSDGAISANNLTANLSSNGFGVRLYNAGAGAVNGAVTLTGVNTFNGNDVDGLNVQSLGAITLNSVTANKNGPPASGAAGASIDNAASSLPLGVKLTGTNTFDGNDGGGLQVYSDGAITINNLTASHSVAGFGASLQNTSAGASGGVTLTGVNAVSENAGAGLDILTTGAVSLTKVTADGNTGDGLFVNASSGNITLTCGSFTNNTASGVDLITSGIATLIGVFASGNTLTDLDLAGVPDLNEFYVRNCPLP